MSLITRIKIGEIRLILDDIVFYKPLYSKNILETILAKVNGNNTVLIKFKCREELEEVVSLLDSISIIKTINSDKNAVEDISLINESDNSSQTSGELIKPLPPDSIVKKEWDEKPIPPKSHKIKEGDINFPKSTIHYEDEDLLPKNPFNTFFQTVKEEIQHLFKNQHKW